MKNAIRAFAVSAVCLTFAASDVDQTKEAKAPDVDVNVSGGQLPEFNVQGPSVEVGTENKVIKVPTVDVDAPPKD